MGFELKGGPAGGVGKTKPWFGEVVGGMIRFLGFFSGFSWGFYILSFFGLYGLFLGFLWLVPPGLAFFHGFRHCSVPWIMSAFGIF